MFWHNIDPLARDGQFCDIGEQYRSAILHHDDEQRRLAEASKRALEIRYKLYRYNCGRDKRLKELWG